MNFVLFEFICIINIHLFYIKNTVNAAKKNKIMKTTEKNQVKFLAEGRGWRGGKKKRRDREGKREEGTNKRKIEARSR